jgi:hypothetical protein
VTLVRAIRQAPSLGRINLDITAQRGGIRIIDTRVTGCKQRLDHFDTDEPAFLIVVVSIWAGDGYERPITRSWCRFGWRARDAGSGFTSSRPTVRIWTRLSDCRASRKNR